MRTLVSFRLIAPSLLLGALAACGGAEPDPREITPSGGQGGGPGSPGGGTGPGQSSGGTMLSFGGMTAVPDCTGPNPPESCETTSAPGCGDGHINQANEECDDGNSTAGDGCSGICKIEPFHSCPTPGQPCISEIVCGDGVLGPGEACDDHNTTSGDGCSAKCNLVEPGYSCRTPGMPCTRVYLCGDGTTDPNEGCDDGNTDDEDGCDSRCRIERGFKCEGSPSVCTPTKCGDGKVEGAESCDDGNLVPFDGCSSTCQAEPICKAGEGCTSRCGDGILLGEECDDGNLRDGDGCSSECKIETEFGFTCKNDSPCIRAENGECVLAVPAIFRDFSDKDPDFGWAEGQCGIPENMPIVPGIAQDVLDAEGRPVLGKATAQACIESAQSFARWWRDDGPVRVVGDIVLYDNAKGGYVNRFGPNGEKLRVTVAPRMGQGTEEQVPNATSQATCEPGCRTRVRNGLQCDNVCRPQHEAVNQRTRALQQAEQELAQRQAMDPPDEAAIALLEETIADLEAEIDMLTATATACDTECTTRFDAQVAACVADCKPCSYNIARYCTGGIIQEFDGTPLFFPVDGVMGPTRDLETARLPSQYGYNGWPAEGDFFPGAKQHNFYFTSEVQYWFRYDADTNARLDFTGDDDVWVYVNGRLAVDLGGIHVPMDGSVTINAQSAARFQLTPGKVYPIVVFQAERKKYGSSFRLTLSGFNAAPSDCGPNCGDGKIAPGEQCDDGADQNTGEYDRCSPTCTLGPRCGDGEIQAPEGEECDDGADGNDGSYDGCAPNCKLGPRCGDGVVQTQFEKCDDGMNTGEYGTCNSDCTLAPRCGDGIVQADQGEECDDGNTSLADSCNNACKKIHVR